MASLGEESIELDTGKDSLSSLAGELFPLISNAEF